MSNITSKTVWQKESRWSSDIWSFFFKVNRNDDDPVGKAENWLANRRQTNLLRCCVTHLYSACADFCRDAKQYLHHCHFYLYTFSYLLFASSIPQVNQHFIICLNFDFFIIIFFVLCWFFILVVFFNFCSVFLQDKISKWVSC